MNIGQTLLEKYTAGQMTVGEVITRLSENGFHSRIFNDGNGGWSMVVTNPDVSIKMEDITTKHQHVAGAVVNELKRLSHYGTV